MATEDLGQYEWGCYGTEVNGADEQAIGTGHQNTMDMYNQKNMLKEKEIMNVLK